MRTFIIGPETKGMGIAEFFKEQELDFTPLAYSINKNLVPHDSILQEGDVVESYSQTHKIGYAVYQKSLLFLLTAVMKEVVPEGRFEISHVISKNIYGCFRNNRNITEEQVLRVKKRMMELIQADVPFQVEMMRREEALKVLKSIGHGNEKWEYRGMYPESIPVYTLLGYSDYYYTPFVASAGLLATFDLEYYMPGLIVRLARRNNPTRLFEFTELPKIFDVIEETNRITDILDISYANALNKQIRAGRGKEIIRIGEALQDQKIAQIAEHIQLNRSKYQLVLISGPSSSGKTTFAQKLEIALMANGQTPISLSLDDFYFDRDKTPLDLEGKPDFENLSAIDVDLFQTLLADLINGETVEIPRYNFNTGMREYRGETLRKEKTSPIIIEGIHGLNPKLTSRVPRHLKYIIYVTALTQLNLDPSNHIKTTDARIIRRIIRDDRYRSFDIERTLGLWSSVRKGEEQNIFRFQELADIHFNSNLPYELNVLKVYADPLLSSVSRDSKYYQDAQNLLNILRYFEPLNSTWVPVFSILREFIGNGGPHD